MLDKCSNPECSTPFDHSQGRYFRFRCARNSIGREAQTNSHAVDHFWLCGQCAVNYALQYHSERGVVITMLLAVPLSKYVPRVIRAA